MAVMEYANGFTHLVLTVENLFSVGKTVPIIGAGAIELAGARPPPNF